MTLVMSVACLAGYGEMAFSFLAFCGVAAFMAPKRQQCVDGKGKGKGKKTRKTGDPPPSPEASGSLVASRSAAFQGSSAPPPPQPVPAQPSQSKTGATLHRGSWGPTIEGGAAPKWNTGTSSSASASDINFPPPPPNAPDFDGGRATVLSKYKCDFCTRQFPFASFLVPCDSQGNVPHGSARIAKGAKVIADLVDDPEPFKNTIDIDVDKADLRNMCYACYGDRTEGDATFYVQSTDGDKVRLRSSFGNVRKRYYGRDARSETDVLAHMAAQAFDRMPSELTWDEVYDKVCRQSAVAAAGDFHVMLGGGVQLRYSCPHCFYLPVHPKFWLRCVKAQYRHTPGCTEQHGDWRCPFEGCLHLWTWGAAGMLRTILVPETNAYDSRMQKMVIGATSPSQEHTITLLKTAKLLETVQRADGSIQQLGKPALVAAIKQLNEEAYGRVLASGLELHNKRVAGKKELREKGIYPYCEDPALSLGNPGATCKAMHLPPSTPVMDPGYLQEVLDVLVCFYDFSQCKVGGGKDVRKAYWDAISTQNSKRDGYFSKL